MLARVGIGQNRNLVCWGDFVIDRFSALKTNRPSEHIAGIVVLNRLIGFHTGPFFNGFYKPDRSMKFHSITSILNFLLSDKNAYSVTVR